MTYYVPYCFAVSPAHDAFAFFYSMLTIQPLWPLHLILFMAFLVLFPRIITSVFNDYYEVETTQYSHGAVRL